MDPKNFRDLLTPIGQDAIQAATALEPVEKNFLHDYQRLEKHFPRELARSALETAILRKQATKKFPQAKKMFFTREALEQSSNFEVANHRAVRFQGHKHIIDLGCSIGGDTMALAMIAHTIGIDLDILRLSMAKENVRTSALAADFIQSDLHQAIPFVRSDQSAAIFFDPARRADNRRIFSVEGYHPPLSTIEKWLPEFPNIGVKLSPAVRLDEIKRYDAEIEFISLGGGLKEAVIWFGALKKGLRRATVLPGPHIMIDDGSPQQFEKRISEPRSFFYEPDPAIIRAGMVKNLMIELNAAQVDLEIAYLTSDEKIPTHFARVWEVEDWFPFQLKRLRTYLRERNVGLVTIKKRGSPIVPEELIQSLRLSKDAAEERIVFLTQLERRPIVVVCFPITTA